MERYQKILSLGGGIVAYAVFVLFFAKGFWLINFHPEFSIIYTILGIILIIKQDWYQNWFWGYFSWAAAGALFCYTIVPIVVAVFIK